MKTFMTFLFLNLCLNSFASWQEVHVEDGITVYAQDGEHRIIPFKAEAILNAPAKKILEVLKDWQNKNKWSPKLKSVKMHNEDESTQYTFSEFYKTPWPATDREFLLTGSIKRLPDGYLLKAKNANDMHLKDDDHIQADVKVLDFRIIKLTESTSKVMFEFHGDMKGWMPAWLINIIQKKWPLRFIQGLRTQL
ncbi:MAG: hypothetical protein GY909_18365 [Oligoflexia bacterium]|nr:hypothetical protein [Oligoflexia bacterium]